MFDNALFDRAIFDTGPEVGRTWFLRRNGRNYLFKDLAKLEAFRRSEIPDVPKVAPRLKYVAKGSNTLHLPEVFEEVKKIIRDEDEEDFVAFLGLIQ